MSLMQWDETMSVGVPELDSQHQTLIGLVNETYEAIQKHDEYRMVTLLAQMREYAVIHFQFEEESMIKSGYPGLERHKELHDAFNDKVNSFQQQLDSKTNFSQIFVFLSRWLTSHIMHEDMKYTTYMPQEEPGGEMAE